VLTVLATSQAPTSSLVSTVIVTVGAVVFVAIGTAVLITAFRGIRGILTKVEGGASQATLEDRLSQLSKSMQQSARLVEQVSAELDARATTARQLQKEAEDAEALAALHKDQADAVRRMIDAELATATRNIRSDSIKIGIASFIAGGGLTLLVTLLVHPLH
jgi:septal ring factor EnvC (AmiA/AmiB activator)